MLAMQDKPAQADLVLCEETIRTGSKSFYAASLLLPKRLRRDAFALYAFCRQSDDLVDLGSLGPAAIVELERRLDLASRGTPRAHPVDRAFADVMFRHGLPRALPAALIEGFAWDVDGRRYRTLEDLLDYAARVAGTVGAMMAVLMGTRSREALARATDLGLAMQLTNIARDVGEDARNGRIYLPLDWLAEEGVDSETWLLAPAFTPGIGRVVERLLSVAEVYYRRGEAGVAYLPGDCRTAIRAAARIYADIGDKLALAGHDSVTRRTFVSKSRKLALVARAALPAPVDTARLELAPAQANAFLVEAATRRSARRPMPEGPFATMLDLLMRIDERQARATRPEA
jgi:15-cis-phytoene synthase